jgi:hypothetical protein
MDTSFLGAYSPHQLIEVSCQRQRCLARTCTITETVPLLDALDISQRQAGAVTILDLNGQVTLAVDEDARITGIGEIVSPEYSSCRLLPCVSFKSARRVGIPHLQRICTWIE